MDIKTAELIVKINDIKCCGICEHFVTYEHDLGSEWYCSERGDINLDDAPFVNVYMKIDCGVYEERR